jgi:hypothetical protein
MPAVANRRPDLKDVGEWIFSDWRRVGSDHLRENAEHSLELTTTGDWKLRLQCSSCQWGYLTLNPIGREACGQVQESWDKMNEDPTWFEKHY